MYESPIEIIYKNFEESFENGIIKAIQKAEIIVDKEELIKALQYDRDSYRRGYKDGVDYANAEEKKGEWISVKERLPKDVEIGEEYPTVIFSTKDAVYCGFYEYHLGNWWAAEDYKVNNVVAWMPLPEPYKEVEDERFYKQTGCD